MAAWLRRLYVPVVTLVLIVAVGIYWAQGGTFAPSKAAQNPRIRFQTGGDAAKAGLTGAEERSAAEVVNPNRSVVAGHTQLLFLGNSQTLAIMDYKPGDLTTPQWLQLSFDKKGDPPVDVRVGSLPNMTPTEYLITLVAAGEAHPRQVDVLLLMTVLEEFRDLGVRSEVAAQLQDPGVRDVLNELVAGNPDLPLPTEALGPILDETTEPSTGESRDRSLAVSIESWFQGKLDELPMFSQRDAMLGSVYLHFYQLRNWLLGLSSSSSRHVPDYEYRASLQLLELALRYAHSQDILPVLYMTPLRPVQPNPNLPADVQRYRRDIPALCDRYEISCFDYTDLVPEVLWTDYPDQQSERDFAHFTGPAHKLVAERLWDDVGPIVTAWAEQTGTG
jgi:hypothetical protein